MGSLIDVLMSLSKGPKAQGHKKPAHARTTVARTGRLPEEKEEPLDLPYRVSPFITEGIKKATVSIDGVLWPRFV
jgi:hypothetical protein